MDAPPAPEARAAVGAPADLGEAGQPRPSRARRRLLGVATPLAYVLLSALIFGRVVLGDMNHTVVGFGQTPAFAGRDQSAYVWFLAWGAHAVFHAQNPFLARVVYAPGGYNLAWAASILGPAIVLAPLTELWGAVVTYNLLAILAPAGAAWAAYLLCRDLTRSWSSAAAGGLLFGFGSYEAGETINHLNLALVGLLPIAALLTLRRARGRISRPRFVVGLGVVLGAQIWISTEVFASAITFGAVALLLGLLTRDGERRAVVRRTALEGGAAVALAVLIGAPYIWYSLTAVDPFPSQTGPHYGTDLANFVFPTQVTWLRPFTTALATNLTEQLAYVGPALLIVLILFFVEFRRRRLARFLGAFILVAVIFSFGTVLKVADQSTGIELPWNLFGKLPDLSHALPGRFIVYVWLAAAVCVALWLDRPTARAARWLAMALIAITLVPNLEGGLWGTQVDRPALLSSPLLSRYVPRGTTVLALPFGSEGNSMFWQVQAKFAFRLAGGYVSWVLPPEYQGFAVIRALHGHPPSPGIRRRLCGFIATTHTSEVLLRLHTRGDWQAILRPLRERPVLFGGFAIYPVAGSGCDRRGRQVHRA